MAARKSNKPRIDVHQDVTDRIVAALEAGTRPWEKSWNGSSFAGSPLRATGQAYQGINVILLWLAGRSQQSWFTYKQAEALKGQVRKGEKGTRIVFFKPLKIKDKATGDDKIIPLLKYYTVFNAEQIDGLPDKFYAEKIEATSNPDSRIDAIEDFIAATGAEIAHGGGRAFYQPGTDSIQLPSFEDFHTGEAYYATALHELAHWTGAKSRLDRDLRNSFGTKDYAREELVAELTAAFLCATLGISAEPRDDHAEYLASWLKVLKEDKRAIFKASTAANKAAAFLADGPAQPAQIAA